MPSSLSGVQLARYERFCSQSTKVIVMSGLLDEFEISDLADATFSKPIDAASLLRTIEKLIEHGPSVTEHKQIAQSVAREEVANSLASVRLK
jgi:hypothetical protein